MDLGIQPESRGDNTAEPGLSATPSCHLQREETTVSNGCLTDTMVHLVPEPKGLTHSCALRTSPLKHLSPGNPPPLSTFNQQELFLRCCRLSDFDRSRDTKSTAATYYWWATGGSQNHFIMTKVQQWLYNCIWTGNWTTFSRTQLSYLMVIASGGSVEQSEWFLSTKSSPYLKGYTVTGGLADAVWGKAH